MTKSLSPNHRSDEFQKIHYEDWWKDEKVRNEFFY
jgi:hypothetical protein